MNLLDRINVWGTRAPERLAHVSPSGSLTYAGLVAGAEAVAALVQCSTAPDDASPVVVLGHKEPELLLGFLGSVRAGHPYVPLDISLPAQRAERIVRGAGARLILTPERIRQATLAAAAPALQAQRAQRALHDHDPYYVMYTSGSSGEPKGVTITLGCLTTFVDWMLAEHGFGETEDAETDEVFLNQAPFSFDLSVMDLYLSLVTGATLVSLTSDQIREPRRLYQALAASGATTWVSTPSFAQLCLADRGFEAAMLPRLRRFLFCGETLPHAVAGQLLDRFPVAEVWNTYGPTEATVATTSVRIDRDVLARYPTLPVGRPQPGSRVVVNDSSGGAAAVGQRGEIVIAGPNVSPGYWLSPDLTAGSFFRLDGQPAYRTGDLGHFEADGLLFFDGRSDSQIKLHGYRIEIGDVESNLRALAEVRDAVVVPLYRDGRLDSMAAVVILREDPIAPAFAASQRIRRALAERVPAYMVPRVVQTVSSFPMTSNGKVDRRALVEMLA